jgi:uncharacterized protein YecE (DUF72 family)
MENITADERIEILLLLKQTVKDFNVKLTQDLVTLIDREADLQNRGRSEAALQALRKRIEPLFLQFCQTLEFNTEAAALQKVPQGVRLL